jgi:Divergent InlB B-repeat domain
VRKSDSIGRRIFSDPPGIDCGRVCESVFPSGTRVRLHTTLAVVWRGPCEEDAEGGSCTFTLTEPTTVSAEAQVSGGETAPGPSVNQHVLNVTVFGHGRVTSRPAGIRCGDRATPCTAFFRTSKVTLFATAAPGWSFKRWGGGCVPAQRPTCSVAVPSPSGVTAAFGRG